MFAVEEKIFTSFLSIILALPRGYPSKVGFFKQFHSIYLGLVLQAMSKKNNMKLGFLKQRSAHRQQQLDPFEL